MQKSRSRKGSSILRGIAPVLLAAAGTLAFAGQPFVHSPSVARMSAAVQFTGGGFQANKGVTLMVRAPNGVESGHGAVTAADGSLSHSLAMPGTGMYVVRVTDTSGAVLASTRVHVVE